MKQLIPENILEDFLAEPILINHVFYIDRWSLVHLSAGFILGYILSHYKQYNIWLIAPVILILYEILEYLFGGIIFEPEPMLDTFWDIIIGMGGFAAYYLIFWKK